MMEPAASAWTRVVWPGAARQDEHPEERRAWERTRGADAAGRMRAASLAALAGAEDGDEWAQQ